MARLTEAQRELLNDKLELWQLASVQGPMDSRDYNKRAAAALSALLEVYDRIDEDDISEAIADSIDMDWNPGVGARAVMARLLPALSKGSD